MITACVILNFNDSITTIKLVDLIKHFEEIDYIVVVDNNSTDQSYDNLKKYETEKVRILKSERNGGYGYGNNYGINYSYFNLKADFLIISNPDVIFSNDCVAELKKVLMEEKNHAISAPIPLRPDGTRQTIIAWKLPTICQEVLSACTLYNKLFGSGKFYKKSHFTNSKYSYVDVVQGSFFMIKAEIMIKCGMYDEEFFLYGEEQVLSKKMKVHGYKSILLANQYYVHNHSVSISKTFSSFYQRKKLNLESRLLYLKKYENLTGLKYLLSWTFFQMTLLFEPFFLKFFFTIKKHRITL